MLLTARRIQPTDCIGHYKLIDQFAAGSVFTGRAVNLSTVRSIYWWCGQFTDCTVLTELHGQLTDSTISLLKARSIYRQRPLYWLHRYFLTVRSVYWLTAGAVNLLTVQCWVESQLNWPVNRLTWLAQHQPVYHRPAKPPLLKYQPSRQIILSLKPATSSQPVLIDQRFSEVTAFSCRL